MSDYSNLTKSKNDADGEEEHLLGGADSEEGKILLEKMKSIQQSIEEVSNLEYN